MIEAGLVVLGGYLFLVHIFTAKPFIEPQMFSDREFLVWECLHIFGGNYFFSPPSH